MQDMHRESAVELDLEEDMGLLLTKPLYGLSDSGDTWYKTLDLHNKEVLKNCSYEY